jgi:hypothetical protein
MTPTSAAAELARRLRDLRRAHHRSGSAFARHLHWSQSRVSKIETGVKMPSRQELAAWIDQTGADPSTASSLWHVWEAARADQPGARVERARRDARATTIMQYQPALVPPVLATAEYAAGVYRVQVGELLGLDDAQVERTVADRRRQQDRLLAGEVETQVVLEEAALHTGANGQHVLLRQLDRLQQLVRTLPNLDLALRPFSAGPPPVPCTNFTVHDRARVHIEGLGRDFTVDEPSEVALWVRGFEIAQRGAARGREALSVIDRARARLLAGDVVTAADGRR